MTKYDFDKSDLICDYDDGMKGIMPKKILGAPSLPPVVTVSYNLVDTVAFIVFQHIPLHIFFHQHSVHG